jgi:hypothetical protein
MKQNFLSVLLIFVLSLILIGSSFGTISQFSYINSVQGEPNQAVNDHITVNRIPQISDSEIEIKTPFQIVILVDNKIDQAVYDVVVNQTIPDSNSGNTLNITGASSNNFNDSWASQTFNTILPGERKTLNVTLQGEGNNTWGTVTLPPLNVTYSFSELFIPAWKQSDIDPQGTPRPLTFNITNSNAEGAIIEGCTKNCIDLNLISPLLFIVVPIFLLVGISFFWSKKNLRNTKKRF